MRAALAALALAACAPTEPQLPGQDHATSIVWSGTYGDRSAAPTVEWVHPEDLNCAGGTGFHLPDGTCVWGVYYSEDRFALVAERSSEFSGTSFAHELLHAHLDRVDGDPDPSHAGADWRPGGALDRANAVLAAWELLSDGGSQ